MRLTIATPEAVLLQREDITALRAEDESGAFGIMPGHTLFLTALAASVVSWCDAAGREGHCALRGGLLTVRDGQDVAIATRQAFLGDDITGLEATLRHEISEAAGRERAERVAAARLQAAAIRRIIGLLRPPGRPSAPGDLG